MLPQLGKGAFERFNLHLLVVYKLDMGLHLLPELAGSFKIVVPLGLQLFNSLLEIMVLVKDLSRSGSRHKLLLKNVPLQALDPLRLRNFGITLHLELL